MNKILTLKHIINNGTILIVLVLLFYRNKLPDRVSFRSTKVRIVSENVDVICSKKYHNKLVVLMKKKQQQHLFHIFVKVY